MQPLFIEPIFKEMIWGGMALKTSFGYTIPSDKTGECWAISGHPKGDCVVKTIKDSEYFGKTLSFLWENNKELWGKSGNREEFPLLTKIISAEKDLSIQVHPDDAYAKANENSLGKTECWYVIDAKEDATIIIGHNAKDKKELESYIDSKNFRGLIREIPVKKGDFFYIPPGTLHAIKAGVIILETQQSSDITYRLYDYDRLQNGKPRELHLDKCKDVIKCPFEANSLERKVIAYGDGSVFENLLNCPFFSVNRVSTIEKLTLEQNEDFTLISVISGAGILRDKEKGEYEIKKGDHLILPNKFGKYDLIGKIEVISSYL